MWCHLPTGFRLIRLLRIVVATLLFVALTTTLFFGISAHAAPATSQTIGFQGRLLDTKGNSVPDGFYNIQFKIYEGGSGTTAGNPDGHLKWTESYVNAGNAEGAVEVTNGILSVNLGSQTPFGSNIDWNSGTLWLSMNVAGSAVGCNTFGTNPCKSDGEMLPMKRMTASPYAMNAGAVGGKTADNLVQLGQGIQTDNSDTPSIFINKTAGGNLIQLQSNAADVFSIGGSGDVTLGGNSRHSISVATATNGTGQQLAITAGSSATTGGSGGDLILQAGSAGAASGSGGNIIIDAGAKGASGSGGTIAIGSTNASDITIGNSTIGTNSNVTIGSGAGAGSGSTTIQSKDAVVIKTDGTTRATFANNSNTAYFGNGSVSDSPSNFTIQAANSSASGVSGGSLTVRGGDVTIGNANGGNIVLAGGSGSGTGVSGSVVISTPTFSTVTNDNNCYTGGAVVAKSCTIAGSSVNNAAAVLVGFSTAGQTATLPDPTLTTAGRIIYVTAAAGSKDFVLSINGGGAGNQITLKPNTTATMMWNGSDWTTVTTTNSSALEYTDNGARVQIGDGTAKTTPTLLTLDKASSAPTNTTDAMLGSMYYDTTLGKLQCYEASGWGNCSASPDNFVSISPQYAGAVTNGTGIGTMTSDLCSDTLNINDGTAAQPKVCGTNETYNYYDWTSAELTAQTKSMYVTYQLPSSFKKFAPGSTFVNGRTDSPNAGVTYQLYKNNTTSGLVACGTAVSVSTGAKTVWQKVTAAGKADPATCNFAPGDSIVFKVSTTSALDAHAYASTLGFAFSNN